MTQFHPSVPLAERLAKRSRLAPSGCIEWQGSLVGSGYGQLRFENTLRRAHRASWTVTHGEIPEGLCVLHRCDNPACINPDHLFLGTRSDNNIDMCAKGRHWHQRQTHCRRGHLLAGENLVFRLKDGRKARVCRACRLIAKTKYNRKMAAARRSQAAHPSNQQGET